MAGHREGTDGPERERDHLRSVAIRRRNRPLTCGDAAPGDCGRRSGVADPCESKRAHSEPSCQLAPTVTNDCSQPPWPETRGVIGRPRGGLAATGLPRRTLEVGDDQGRRGPESGSRRAARETCSSSGRSGDHRRSCGPLLLQLDSQYLTRQGFGCLLVVSSTSFAKLEHGGWRGGDIRGPGAC
jgi:hypothetical protein